MMLLIFVRKFLLSVMGPALDGKPPPRKSKVNYSIALLKFFLM